MKTEKDPSIHQLLEAVSPERRGWIVVDYWEADLCAIGFAKQQEPRRLVYVSTYGKAHGVYDYECEVPTGGSPEEHVTAETGEDVGLSSLIAVLERHLNGTHE